VRGSVEADVRVNPQPRETFATYPSNPVPGVKAGAMWQAALRVARRTTMSGLSAHSPAPRPWRQGVIGSLSVAALTLICFQSHLAFAFAWPLYLLVVLLSSLSGELVSSAFIAVIAAASLDYFFVSPLFSFSVSNPLNILALVSFLVTGLIVATLVSRVRAEAKVAKLQKERLDCLYRLAQQLLAMEPEMVVGTRFLEPFEGIFGLTAACIFDPVTAEVHTVGQARRGLVDKTRDAYIFEQDFDDRDLGISARRLQVRGRITGAIGFEGLEDPELTAGPLVALAATLQERTRAFRDARDSAAAAQVEIYRTAILDALAHEFKTPLATILAAAGGLGEAGPLGQGQREMAETIEAEAARLGSLTSRLLHIARLDREDVHPQIESMSLAPLIVQTVSQYSRIPSDRRISLEQRDELFEVIADPELLRLAFSQLLDNACKYSLPGSAVTVRMERRAHFIAIKVSNSGSSIPLGEQHRIFERFYRGTEARRFTSGSGLGLYVARKIALAHQGALELEGGRSSQDCVTFCLSIPRAENDFAYAATVN
jgi:two-component system, OmpR family, sensor histidine kinase KdpD